jgi:hypothetical protein
MKTFTAITLLVLATSLYGCSVQFAARDADGYRQDTRALLATKNGDIKRCYDAQIAGVVKPSGKVVVTFVVQEETGQIINASLDKQQTTAPEGLSQCVLDALNGLALEPPDQRQGVASFVWEFTVKS